VGAKLAGRRAEFRYIKFILVFDDFSICLLKCNLLPKVYFETSVYGGAD